MSTNWWGSEIIATPSSSRDWDDEDDQFSVPIQTRRETQTVVSIQVSNKKKSSSEKKTMLSEKFLDQVWPKNMHSLPLDRKILAIEKRIQQFEKRHDNIVINRSSFSCYCGKTDEGKSCTCYDSDFDNDKIDWHTEAIKYLKNLLNQTQKQAKQNAKQL